MLITRPRISLGAVSCTSEVIVEKTIISDAPVKRSRTSLSQIVCDMENARISRPEMACIVSEVTAIRLNFPSQEPTNATTFEPVTVYAIMLLFGASQRQYRVDIQM